MAALAELNNLATTRVYKKISELELNKLYQILGANRMTTTYGPAIQLELPGIKVYLPKRFNALSDLTLADMTGSGRFGIKYTGDEMVGRSVRNKVEFGQFCAYAPGFYAEEESENFSQFINNIVENN